MITTYYNSGFTALPDMKRSPRRMGVVRWQECFDDAEAMIERCDPRWVLHKTVKLEALGCLVWDYLDTVCNVAAMQGRQETKAYVRELRVLCRQHNRDTNVTEAMTKTRAAIAEHLHGLCEAELTRLYYGVDFELSRRRLGAEDKELMTPVFQFLALVRAWWEYAKRMSAQMREQGVRIPALVLSSPRLPRAVALVAKMMTFVEVSNAAELTGRALANKLEREDVAEALLETAQDTLEACRR